MQNITSIQKHQVKFHAARNYSPQQNYNPNAGLPIGRDAYVKYQEDDHDKKMEKYMKYLAYSAVGAACILGVTKLVKLPWEKAMMSANAEHSRAATAALKGEEKAVVDTASSIYEDLTHAKGLEDMVLAESVEKETKGIINNITNLFKVVARGGEAKKSILLFGPPGTGKTTYAKAIAKHFKGAKFAALDVTKMKDKYVGETEKNINALIDKICEEADRMALEYKQNLGKVIGEDVVNSGNQKEILKAIEKAKANGKEIPIQERIFVFIDEIDSVMMVDTGSGAKFSNDMLNEFKKGFTEKLGKRDNIITMGATNLEIDASKAATGDGKMLDKPMLDRFQSKVRVPNPDKRQIKESMKMHYKDCDFVSDKLKNDNELLDRLSEFLSQEKFGISFRKLESIYNEAANSTAENTKPLEIKDIVNALKTMKEDLKMTEREIDSVIAI